MESSGLLNSLPVPQTVRTARIKITRPTTVLEAAIPI